MTAALGATRAVLVALPFGAGAALALARLLPIEFAYRENALGIVGWATLERYPQQQETFWLLTSALCAVGVAWALSRWLAPRAARVPAELSGAAALLGLLWLPGAWGFALALAAAAVLVLATRAGEATSATGVTAGALVTPLRPRTLGLLAAGAALLLTPDLPANVWSVLHGFSDEARALASFPFMGEIGQHLAWGDALRRGQLHGRDFFCLYGPLYDLGLVATWQVFGRSVAAWDLYFSLTRMLALTGAIVLAGLLLRRRALALLLPFLVPWVSLRSGLAFIGLAFLLAWMRRERPGLALAAGATAGVALLFSQEFGVAYVLVAALAFALHRSLRGAVQFGASAAAVAAPVLGWYAANGALFPMLQDLVAYPAYMLAGYAKLPFPALVAQLPLAGAAWGSRELLAHQLGYAVPAICIGAALLAAPVAKLDLRAPLASLSAVRGALRADPQRATVLLLAVFGMLAFRSALGRSDLKHLIDVVPSAAILLVVACDRVVAGLRSSAARPVAAGHAALLALLVAHTGFTLVPTPLRTARDTLVVSASVWIDGRAPIGDRGVAAVVRRIRSETRPGEPILALPNNAAYYYLADRPSAMRFVMGHQIVTQAQRDEVLADLRAEPPRLLVWDEAALRIDGLDDVLVLGQPLMDWLDASYVEFARVGAVSLRRLREAATGDG